MESHVRIAVAQLPAAQLENWRQTRATIHAIIDDAVACHAELLLLPEGAWPVYLFDSQARYRDALAGDLPSHEQFLDELAGHARNAKLAICAGLIEHSNDHLYNTAVLIDPRGRLCGTYRKCFLWDHDNACFVPGEHIAPLATPFGPVGIMICADARQPEIAATLVTRGARLLLQPTAWVNAGPPERPWNPQADFLVRSRATEFGLPIVSADKCGLELDTLFVGQSLICDAAGRVIAQAGSRHPELLVADVDLAHTPQPPVITKDERAALLNVAEPTLPPNDTGELAIRLEPIAPPDSSESPALDVHLSAAGGESLTISRPTSALQTLGAIRIATIAGRDASRFAPARVAAVHGCHLLVVFGDKPPGFHLRTRAAENRMFVLAVGAQRAQLIDPGGQIIHNHTAADGRIAWHIDPALAANKLVAPQTNVILGRRPELYTL